MKLTADQIAKLEAFLERIKNETYPEPLTVEHSEITRRMLNLVWPICGLPAGARVLDVGCGQGVALEHFVERGCDVTGITLNTVDLDVCRGLGYRVLEMDQSFLDFPNEEFDLVWCRHCLEHSIFPAFTLSEFRRVIRPGGWLYIEVPAPDTSCNHQFNQNHYSVLGKSMLASLIERSGFDVKDVQEISLQVPIGPDTYWAFLQQRKT